jgi:hypothetical protein
MPRRDYLPLGYEGRAMTDETVAELTSALPEYRCHKSVRAARIVEVGPVIDALNSRIFEVEIEEAGAPALPQLRLSVPAAVFARGLPRAGDYIVVYPSTKAQPEGYISWSPKAVFEEGYILVNDLVHAPTPDRLLGLPGIKREGRPDPDDLAAKGIFAGEPDARQSTETELTADSGLFRKRYRKLSAEELLVHDNIKDQAEQLLIAIGYVHRPPLDAEHPTRAESENVRNFYLSRQHLEDAVYRAVKALTG